MMNTQIIPNAFYGIQNFIDSLNAANAKGECTYTPKADYYETEKGFALEVEIPGVKKEDLDVQVEKKSLVWQSFKHIYQVTTRLLSRQDKTMNFSIAKRWKCVNYNLTLHTHT